MIMFFDIQLLIAYCRCGTMERKEITASVTSPGSENKKGRASQMIVLHEFSAGKMQV